MKNLIKSQFCLIVIVFGLFFPLFAGANTISNTYNKAFSDPYHFDSWLDDEMANSNFYRQFAGCYQAGSSTLDTMERRVESEYRTCSSNSECHDTAKDVQLVRELKHNFNNLANYISEVQDKERVKFLDSEIGKVAKYINRIGINLDRNEAFQKQLDILSSIPCK